MYRAVFDQVTTLGEAEEHLKPFIQFDARRRNIEIDDDDRFAILRIDTSMSYVSVPLGYGITLDKIVKELVELETQLDPHARAELERLLNDQ